MAGRGRGADLFRKLAKLEAEKIEQEEEAAAAAAVRPFDTESTTSAYQETELDTKFQDAHIERYATSDTELSIGSGTLAAAMKGYMQKVAGDDESIASTDYQPSPSVSEAVKPSFNIGRGRGMFAVPAPKTGSTSDSDKQSKPLQGTSDDKQEEGGTGVLPKLLQGRGRGLIFTSGRGTGSSGPSKSLEGKSEEDVESQIDRLALSDNQSQPEKILPDVVEPKEIPQPVAEKPAKEVITKQGKKGKPYGAITNSIIIQCEKDYGMFEYDVRYKPALDNVRSRHVALRAMAEVIGTIRTYDGGETLYLPHKLQENSVTQVINDPPNEINNIQVVITFRRKRSLDECLHFYNVLFERVMMKLNYERVGRKYFDPLQPKVVPQHKLAVWPGYVKAIDELEGGLMLTLDVSHRVLNQRTVYDFIDECIQKSKRGGDGNWQTAFKKGIINCIVTTKYNNKTYRIDDVAFDQNPMSTWTDKEGKECSYADYYKNQHGITLKDLKQPILLSRKDLRVSGRKDKLELSFGLIPELCQMTGLTDEMRSNFSVMKDLAQHTKLSPFQRIGAYKKFIERVNGNPKAKQLLDDWGLKIERDPVKVTARVLDDEKIIFGGGKTYDIGPNADFNRAITSNYVLEAYDLTNWILVFDKRDKQTAENFEGFVHKVSGTTGMKTSKARRIELPNDRVDTYVSTIRDNITNDKSIQFVVIIFPTLRDDRYAAVKRVLCADLAIPSQCINAKTLKNEAKNRSIVQKILLQINCKLGGSLWGINIPLKNTMIVGMDTYHGSTDAKHGAAVGGLCATINGSFTRYFSKPHVQGKKEELISGLTAIFVEALQSYQNHNNKQLPDRIIYYRDGVGDGMLEQVRQVEIVQFEYACKLVDSTYKPKITFMVVQKHVNTKFFKMLNRMKDGLDEVANPPPGSILDNTITRRYFYDFYLCAQNVREGTTTPSHYIVMRDDNNFDPDILQKLTYKLTYMYYNWPGAVRVPAPCQYAHKLVELIGAAVQRQPHAKLNDKLYFL